MQKIVNGNVVNLTQEEEAEVLAQRAYEESKLVNAGLDAQILALEATVTQRRLREAALTDEGKAWLADVDDQITALRAQRV